MEYEEHRIKTTDGYTLNSWHIAPQGNAVKCSIILSYGDTGNMASGLYIAGLLTQKGFDVWLYDYRGFGKSDDFEMNLDQLYCIEFVRDLSAMVDTVKAANPNNKICLFGISMGTIINTLYYQEHPDNVDFYVGEGMVYSPEKLVTRIKAEKGKEVLLPQLDVHFEQVYADMKIPFLLFFASRDTTCTHDELLMLQQKVANLKIINYEGGHVEGPKVLGPQQYVQHMADFLNNNIQ